MKKKLLSIITIILITTSLFAVTTSKENLKTLFEKVPDNLQFLDVSDLYLHSRPSVEIPLNTAQPQIFVFKTETNDETGEQTYSFVTKPDNIFYKNGIFIDFFLHTSLIRGSDFMMGGSLAMGYRGGNTLGGLYARADYPLKPLGESSGSFVIRELKGEVGASFSFVVQASGKRETKIFLDLGYYVQYLEYARDFRKMYMINNGVILRPGLNTKIDLYLFRLEVGIYYQAAIYPRYTGYDGVGVYMKLF